MVMDGLKEKVNTKVGKTGDSQFLNYANIFEMRVYLWSTKLLRNG